MTEFENLVINFGLKTISAKEFEEWVYQHNEIEEEIGSDLYLDLISANFSNPNEVVDVLNPWFQKRYPNAFLKTDLRQLYNSTHSDNFISYLLPTLE